MTTCTHCMHPPKSYKLDQGIMINFASGKRRPLFWQFWRGEGVNQGSKIPWWLYLRNEKSVGYKRIFKKCREYADGTEIHKVWQTWALTGADGSPRIPHTRIVWSRDSFYRMVQCSSTLHTLSPWLERNIHHTFEFRTIAYIVVSNEKYWPSPMPIWGQIDLTEKFPTWTWSTIRPC